MSDVLEIRVKKSHIAVLSVVVLVASASAAVNIRDPMNVFGDLNVRGGELDMHQNQITNTTEVEFSSDYLKKYAGEDGKIDDAGLAQANQDFGSDKLSASQLRTVETFFQNKVPVKNNILEEYDSDGNNKITEEESQDATRDFIVDGELSKGEINLIQYYFRNKVPITEPASSIDAAKITSSGKLIANGIIGRQKANFTIGNDINMQGNNIYNIGNLNGQTGGTTGGGGLTIPPYNDISNERQFGTTYTNNHNGPRLVTVITGSFNAANRLVALVNGKRVQGYGSLDSSSEGLKTVSFLVPQGANYRIKTQGGQDSLLEWYEQDLQGGTGGDGGDEQTGGGGGGSTSNTAPPLDWSNAQPQSDGQQITCDLDEVLEDVTCSRSGSTGIDNANSRPVACESRTRKSAKAPGSSGLSRVTGTCVPIG